MNFNIVERALHHPCANTRFYILIRFCQENIIYRKNDFGGEWSLVTADISVSIFCLKWKIILFVSSGAVRPMLPGDCGGALCANHNHVITLVDEILPLSQFLNFTSLQVIRRDIARTYPEHEFFKKKDGVGQESLFNVMKAYSVHDRKWFKYHFSILYPLNITD